MGPSPPARCPFSPFFGWEGSPTKIDKTEKSWYPYSNLCPGNSWLESNPGSVPTSHFKNPQSSAARAGREAAAVLGQAASGPGRGPALFVWIFVANARGVLLGPPVERLE